MVCSQRRRADAGHHGNRDGSGAKTQDAETVRALRISVREARAGRDARRDGGRARVSRLFRGDQAPTSDCRSGTGD